MSREFVTIDGIPVEIENEKNMLELIRKAGIKMPTFCYHSELSVYGACRMCMMENERGQLEAACSTPPRAGGVFKTNTPRLRKYRKMILELLLANHCRDCTTCENNRDCKLQALATAFHIEGVRFPNTNPEPKLDESSLCITRDASKCILCGDCVRVCTEIQNVGAIDFINRGSKMSIGPAFNAPISQSPCVGCGQCAAVCPTGAIVVHNNVAKVWDALENKDVKVSIQVAPAVRVALGEKFGLAEGTDVMGKITAALHRMGFNEVYDTSTSADLTVVEEANEFLERLEKGGKFPMFTSCCPAWINYAEKNHPELLENISSCRSPMQMFASVLKTDAREKGEKLFHIAVMPCTAKKFEADRDEFRVNGEPNVDAVLTTQELVRMIKETGIVFEELEPEAVDLPFGSFSGAGVIFGVTGGVTEAVIRKVSADKSRDALKAIANIGVRGTEGMREFDVPAGDVTLHIGVVSGLANAERIIKRVEAGEHFDLIEVMSCPGGCVAGGGQPIADSDTKKVRGKGLYASDLVTPIRRSDDNPVMKYLYDGLLKNRTHELLHVHYGK